MKKIFLSLALVVAVTAVSQAQNVGTFKFKEETWDFGNIAQNKPVRHNFTFTNTGSAPIVIQNVQASCGCTTPSWPKEPIMPGRTETIEVGFNAASPGGFNKSITITSNAAEPTKMLYIKGTVEAAPKDQTTPEKAPSMLNTTPKN